MMKKVFSFPATLSTLQKITVPPPLLLFSPTMDPGSSSSSAPTVPKDHKSSVCVIPPVELQGAIQALRQVHDKQINRWPPHINMMYPFVPFSQFKGKVLETLTHVGAKIKPFKLTFAEFGYFTHGKKSATVWLRPVTVPGNALQALEEALVEAFPQYNDLMERAEVFSPHLTVGQFGGKVKQTVNPDATLLYFTLPNPKGSLLVLD